MLIFRVIGYICSFTSKHCPCGHRATTVIYSKHHLYNHSLFRVIYVDSKVLLFDNNDIVNIFIHLASSETLDKIPERVKCCECSCHFFKLIWETGREGQTETAPIRCFLHQMPATAKARSLELNRSFPHGWQLPHYLSHLLLFPRVYIRRKLETGARARNQIQELWYGIQAS